MAKIIKVPKWVMPFGYGLALWNLVLVRKDSSNIKYVTEHELVHVEQWHKIGFFKFPYLYIRELVRVGYYNNKYEVEARKLGAERSLYQLKQYI